MTPELLFAIIFFAMNIVAIIVIFRMQCDKDDLRSVIELRDVEIKRLRLRLLEAQTRNYNYQWFRRLQSTHRHLKRLRRKLKNHKRLARIRQEQDQEKYENLWKWYCELKEKENNKRT